jgi:hypothetical protein
VGLRVPEGFDRGVRQSVMDAEGVPVDVVSGASPDAVAKVAGAKATRLRSAIDRYNTKLNELLGEGYGEDVAIRNASRELDDAATLIKQHVTTVPGDDPPVIADMALALMELQPRDRSMLLRRAGNPEIFAPLVEGDMPDPDTQIGQTTAVEQEGRIRRGAAQSKSLDSKLDDSTNRDSLPASQRPSMLIRQEGKTRSTGTVVKPSDVWKTVARKKENSPLDVDTTLREDVAAVDGQEEAASVPLNSQQQRALQDLAGDQINERIYKLGSALVDRGIYTRDELVDRLGGTRSDGKKRKGTADGRAEIEEVAKANNIPEPSLPKVVQLSSKEREVERIVYYGLASPKKAQRMTAQQRYEILEKAGVGSDLAAEAAKEADGDIVDGSGVLRTGTGRTWNKRDTDDVVATRQMSELSRTEQLLYRLTEPSVSKNNFDEAMVDHNGKPLVTLGGGDTIIDLDATFPWWRGRFGVRRGIQGQAIDSDFQYPAKQKDARWLTAAIQGVLNNRDPSFMRRMLPLVERSIAAAPAKPGESVMREGGKVVGRKKKSGQTKAERMQSEVFTPAPEIQEGMISGPGQDNAAYQYPIYTDEDIEAPAVQTPSGVPVQQFEQELQPEYQPGADPEVDAMMQKFEELRRRAAGNNDVSSINNARSPIYGLLS